MFRAIEARLIFHDGGIGVMDSFASPISRSISHLRIFWGERSFASPIASKQASKQCLFVNAGWYMGSYTADVDLRLGCPQSDILERMSWVLIYRPREEGQLSWLVATCVSSSDDWIRTRDLPRPTLRLNHSATLTTFITF